MTAAEVIKELQLIADPVKGKFLQGFFKTYDGGYAAGDKFIGITVPVQRSIAKKHRDLPLGEVRKLIGSDIHEHRFVALEILVFKYEKGDEAEKKKVVDFYLANRKWVNNWDLVDTSAPYILGDRLLNKDRAALYDLAKSKNIWDRRIAIVSTLAFIRAGESKDTVKISGILLRDTHDLIHKASGWMLREMGKKSPEALLKFLDTHAAVMPRTMLRYAIEKFSRTRRNFYLSVKNRSRLK